MSGPPRVCQFLEERHGFAGALRTLGGWGAISGPPLQQAGLGGHLGAPQYNSPGSYALPLAELLALHVGPDLLGHDRGSDRTAAEHGLERVLAALEADVVATERLLALRHVPSSLPAW